MKNAQALREASLPLAREVNPDTVRELTEALKKANTENFLLRRRESRAASQAKLTEAIVNWIIGDARGLVFDVEGDIPMQVDYLLEVIRIGNEWESAAARKAFARHLAAAIHAGSYPRQLCDCGEVECRGCAKGPADIALPVAIRNLIAENRHA